MERRQHDLILPMSPIGWIRGWMRQQGTRLRDVAIGMSETDHCRRQIPFEGLRRVVKWQIAGTCSARRDQTRGSRIVTWGLWTRCPEYFVYSR